MTNEHCWHATKRLLMCFARNKGGVAAVPGLALPRIPAEPQLFGARLLVL